MITINNFHNFHHMFYLYIHQYIHLDYHQMDVYQMIMNYHLNMLYIHFILLIYKN